MGQIEKFKVLLITIKLRIFFGGGGACFFFFFILSQNDGKLNVLNEPKSLVTTSFEFASRTVILAMSVINQDESYRPLLT
jgi:hypothetical protein